MMNPHEPQAEIPSPISAHTKIQTFCIPAFPIQFKAPAEIPLGIFWNSAGSEAGIGEKETA